MCQHRFQVGALHFRFRLAALYLVLGIVDLSCHVVKRLHQYAKLVSALHRQLLAIVTLCDGMRTSGEITNWCH